jgi:methylmalonyl-CoA/ethylmalonyl-CoA epimerase
MSPEPSFGRIHQIALHVTDLDRSIAWYRDVLSLPFLFQAPNVAFFDCAGTRLMVSPLGSGAFRPSSSVLYFGVADIHDAARILCGRGLAFGQEPHLVARLPDREVWLAEFADPDGNPLALMSERPVPRPEP